MISEEEVSDAARTAVTTWVREMTEAGFKTVAEVNTRDEGRALEQSLAIFLDTVAIDLYPRYAAQLSDAGLSDGDLAGALAESVQRMNLQVLRRLLELGFRVEKLLDLCERGQSLNVYFTHDHH